MATGYGFSGDLIGNLLPILYRFKRFVNQPMLTPKHMQRHGEFFTSTPICSIVNQIDRCSCAIIFTPCYLPRVIQVKNAFKSWLLDIYMPGGINQQVFIYLDQFSAQARGLTLVGLAGLFITAIMTLSVIVQPS